MLLHLNIKWTCTTKILRIKNTFLTHRQEVENDHDIHVEQVQECHKNEWLYKYNDIKINVLIEFNRMSLVGECQFLLCGVSRILLVDVSFLLFM